MLKEICGALLASDVNVQLVQRLRTNIKAAVNVQDVGAGINKKRLVQKVRFFLVQQFLMGRHNCVLTKSKPDCYGRALQPCGSWSRTI